VVNIETTQRAECVGIRLLLFMGKLIHCLEVTHITERNWDLYVHNR
jgi:hypothetical protein